MIFKIATWGFGVLFLIIGVVSWLNRRPYGVELRAVDALAEINSVVVGLHLAIGSAIVIFAALGRHAAGMLIGTLTVAGLAAVRIAEMVVGSAATTRQWILLAPEIAGLVVGVALLLPRLRELRSPEAE